MSYHLIVVALFLLVLIAIGQWSTRQVRTTEDFHLAGRRLTRLPAALSLAATEFSGSGLLGGAGLAFSIGIAGSYWNLSAVPAWLILAFTVATAFRALELTSVPQFLGDRYGKRTEVLAAIAQMSGGIIFLGVQILTSALAVSILLGLPESLSAVVITAVFVLFTTVGGLVAVVWTDVFCYVVLMTAVVLAGAFTLSAAGGWSGLVGRLPSEHFDLGRLGTMEPMAWVSLCFYSYSTDQSYLQRVFATRDASVARFSYLFTGFSYLVFGGAVALLGLGAMALLPSSSLAEVTGRPDLALPSLIRHTLPSALQGFFLAGILATTISTASAYLAAASTIAFKTLCEPIMKSRHFGGNLIPISRAMVVAVAAVALAIALAAPGIVNAVVISTMVSNAAVFFPVLAALYWKGVPRRAGFWAILGAAASGLVSQFALYKQAAGVAGAIHPLFVGPAAGLLILILWSFAEPAGEKEAK